MPGTMKDKEDMNMISGAAKTNAPQTPVGKTGGCREGIVRGIARGTTTKVLDGIVRGGFKEGKPFERKVEPSATKIATQEFGSGRFAKGAYGK